MERTIPLSTSLGEIMAPQTLVTALIVDPAGTVTVDPGALHGRSLVESHVEFVKQRDLVTNGETYWMVWVAVEMDAANQPVGYKGASVSELLIAPDRRVGYKSLAEATNRITQAIRGMTNLAPLNPHVRSRIKQQLISIGTRVWERASDSFKQAFEL